MAVSIEKSLRDLAKDRGRKDKAIVGEISTINRTFFFLNSKMNLP